MFSFKTVNKFVSTLIRNDKKANNENENKAQLYA